MNKIFSIIVVAAVLLSVNACKQTNNKQTENRENTEVSINYLTVDEVLPMAKLCLIKLFT